MKIPFNLSGLEIIVDSEKIPRLLSDNPELDDALRAHYEKLAEQQEISSSSPEITLTTDFSLEEKPTHWQLTGVPYRDGIYLVELYNQLLPSRTQDKHIEDRIANPDKPYIVDAPFHHSIFATLFKNKDHPRYKEQVELVRKFLDKNLKATWLSTSSRARYNPAGLDLVIHGVGLPERYETQANLVAPDRFATSEDDKALQAMYKADSQEIIQVHNWLTKVNPYIFRLNTKLRDNPEERVVGFDAYSSRSGLSWRYLLGSDPAFGVRARKIS